MESVAEATSAVSVVTGNPSAVLLIDTDNHQNETISVVAVTANGTKDLKADVHAATHNGNDGSGEAGVVQLTMDAQFWGPNENGIIRRRLLIDGNGGGDEKKLTKLIEMYIRMLDVADQLFRENISAAYEEFKLLIRQCDGMKSVVDRTFFHINTTLKAQKYWEMIMVKLQDEISDMRIMVRAQRLKIEEINLNKQRNSEAAAAKKLLDGSQDRSLAEKELQKLVEEHKVLEAKNAELTALLKFRKVHVNLLCDLAKDLRSDSPEVLEQAISQVEERVLSDVSMDLE